MGSMLKGTAQLVLKRLGLYQRFKVSYAYDLYWAVSDRRMLAARSKEVAFYRSVLSGLENGDLIIDVGANCGEKTDIFLRLGAKVLAIEPDASNQLTLTQRFRQWRLIKKNVVVVGKAVSDQEGVQTLYVNAAGSALNTMSKKWVDALGRDDHRFGAILDFKEQRQIETTTLQKLIEEFGAPFFIKIDVEGSELDVLRGLQQPVGFLSFEVNLPEFRAEGHQCIERLCSLDVNGTFNLTVSCQEGLLLDQWLDGKEFVPVFEKCDQRSVEIFWRTRVMRSRNL